MTRRLVIAGAGGFGRSVRSWVTASPRWAEAQSIGELVFIDDAQPQVPLLDPLVASIADYRPEPADLVLVAVASAAARRGIVTALSQRGAAFGTFVADTAIVGDSVTLGEGSIVCPSALLSTDIVIGAQVHISPGCIIGHDSRIGDFSTLSPGCRIGGGVILGEDAFVGSAVTVIPELTVGASAYLGAGSVVVKAVATGTKVFGNPARVIGRST